MIVLEADGFFRIVHDPAREEDGAVKQFIAQVYNQAHIRSGWLCPGNFIDTLPYPYDIGLLIFYPTVCHKTAMNTVIKGGLIFYVNLVVPAIVIGINKVFANEAAFKKWMNNAMF